MRICETIIFKVGIISTVLRFRIRSIPCVTFLILRIGRLVASEALPKGTQSGDADANDGDTQLAACPHDGVGGGIFWRR